MKSILANNTDKGGDPDASNEEESKEDKQKPSRSKSFWRSMTSKSMKSPSDGNEDESKKDSEKI